MVICFTFTWLCFHKPAAVLKVHLVAFLSSQPPGGIWPSFLSLVLPEVSSCLKGVFSFHHCVMIMLGCGVCLISGSYVELSRFSRKPGAESGSASAHLFSICAHQDAATSRLPQIVLTATVVISADICTSFRVKPSIYLPCSLMLLVSGLPLLVAFWIFWI